MCEAEKIRKKSSVEKGGDKQKTKIYNQQSKLCKFINQQCKRDPFQLISGFFEFLQTI